jgi:hypothetical protein
MILHIALVCHEQQYVEYLPHGLIFYTSHLRKLIYGHPDNKLMTKPQSFKGVYPTTRCTIDATEIYIKTPSNPQAQQLTYSSYKNHNTLSSDYTIGWNMLCIEAVWR